MTEIEEFINMLERANDFFSVQKRLYGDRLYGIGDVENIALLASEHVNADLVKLKNKVIDCRRCTLASSRKQVVFGSGNANSEILLIGEAPGYHEDQKGEPFVGEAGQLLNKILAAIGLDRKKVYITNIVKCRPPNNRDPEPHERAACFPILQKQMEIIKPKYILALGRIAAHVLLNTQRPLSNLRNRVYKKFGATLVVTYHPAALLRNPGLKRDTWIDVQLFQKCFSGEYAGEIIDLDNR